jgi:F-type H+-transporting ATPase subunit b
VEVKLFPKVFQILLLVTLLPAAALAEGAGDPGGDHPEEAAAHEDGAHGAHAINWWDMSDGADGETPPLGYMFINFALLLVLVFMIMRKPIGRRVRVRRETVEKALAEAKEMTARAEAALAEARGRMEALDVEMARIRKEILDAGKGESERIAGEARDRSRRMQEDTSALVGQEVARMSAAIREEVVEGIVSAARDLLARKIGGADHARLSREYLESINDAVETGARGREV